MNYFLFKGVHFGRISASRDTDSLNSKNTFGMIASLHFTDKSVLFGLNFIWRTAENRL